MSNHTPGPWLLRTAPTSAGLCHIISAADWRGAFIYGDGLRIGVDDSLPKAQELAANARLIAAAPDLLGALKACQQAIREMRTYGAPTAFWDGIEAAARAAIAKAEGR